MEESALKQLFVVVRNFAPNNGASIFELLADGPWALDVKATRVWFRQLPSPFKPRRFVMPCRQLCGLELKRFHLTCLFCRARKTYYGHLPSVLEVTPFPIITRYGPYLLLARKTRMFKAFRDALIWKIFGFYGLLSSHGVTVKQLLTLAEFFA